MTRRRPLRERRRCASARVRRGIRRTPRSPSGTSRALNSSLPFMSSMRAAAQRRSRAGASRKTRQAARGGAGRAGNGKVLRLRRSAPASANTPPTPCPSIFSSAAFKSASVGMPSRSAEDELEGFGGRRRRSRASRPRARRRAAHGRAPRFCPAALSPISLSPSPPARLPPSPRRTTRRERGDERARAPRRGRRAPSAEVLPDCDPRDARRALREGA